MTQDIKGVLHSEHSTRPALPALKSVRRHIVDLAREWFVAKSDDDRAAHLVPSRRVLQAESRLCSAIAMLIAIETRTPGGGAA